MNLPPILTIVTAGTLLIQTAVPPDITSFVTPLERLTLVGALLVAVKVLWTSVKEKDDQVTAMTKQVTETMVLVMEAVKESRTATEELGSALDQLTSNISALPCTSANHGILDTKPHNG